MDVQELEQIAENVKLESGKFDYEVNVCMGTGCMSQHSDKIKDEITKAAAASGKKVFVRRTGCMGLCAAGPLVLVEPTEVLYQAVKAEDAARVIESVDKAPIAELHCDLRAHFDDQVHVVLENSGHIDPEKIDDYIGRDGYAALLKALTEMTPETVIEQIAKSGLK